MRMSELEQEQATKLEQLGSGAPRAAVTESVRARTVTTEVRKCRKCYVEVWLLMGLQLACG